MMNTDEDNRGKHEASEQALTCAQAIDILCKSKSAIINEWEKRWRDEVPAAKHVARLSRVSSLPNFLDNLTRKVNSPSSAAQADSNAEVACEHAEERARLGNCTLAEFIGEYQILREVGLLQLEVGLPLSTPPAGGANLFFTIPKTADTELEKTQ